MSLSQLDPGKTTTPNFIDVILVKDIQIYLKKIYLLREIINN